MSMSEISDDPETDDGLEYDEATGQWIPRTRMPKIRGVDGGAGKTPPLKGSDARAQERGKVRYLAAELGIPEKEAGAKIHQAKDEAGLRGQQNLTVRKKGKLSYEEEDLTSDV